MSPEIKPEHHVAADQLRVGLYIYIDLPWFRHPFTLNSFKISSADQLRSLRALGLTQFRYDPERSDSPAFVDVEPDTPEAQNVHAVEAELMPSLDPAMLEKNARIVQLEERKKAVALMEKAFLQAATVMRNITKNLMSRPKETLAEMEKLIDQMVSVFLDSPALTLQVMGEKCGGEDAYYHGLNVSILSMLLAKELNFSREQARLLAAGAMLHDIGLLEIPDRVLRKSPTEYSRPERELRAMHVEYSVNIGRQLGLPSGVLLILAQHHEYVDGSGYPGALKADKMSPLTQLVSLVNYYDNLCNPLDFNEAMTPHEALSHMFAHQRTKFDGKMLQLMIRSLGVYPPGSIVKLSNEAIAMVVSINPQKALRPWVLLYDPAVPKEEAIMLNLEDMPELSISKAIRPALLPPRVYAYLSPRKRVTYFFDSDSTTPATKA